MRLLSRAPYLEVLLFLILLEQHINLLPYVTATPVEQSRSHKVVPSNTNPAAPLHLRTTKVFSGSPRNNSKAPRDTVGHMGNFPKGFQKREPPASETTLQPPPRARSELHPNTTGNSSVVPPTANTGMEPGHEGSINRPRTTDDKMHHARNLWESALERLISRPVIKCPKPREIMENPVEFPLDPEALRADGEKRYRTFGIHRSGRRPDFRVESSRVLLRHWVGADEGNPGECFYCGCNGYTGGLIQARPLAGFHDSVLSGLNYRYKNGQGPCQVASHPEKCENWFGCYCLVELKQPKLDLEGITFEDWQEAMQELPDWVKQQNQGFTFSYSYAHTPGDMGPAFEIDINGNPLKTFSMEKLAPPTERYLAPGYKEPYYLEGRDRGGRWDSFNRVYSVNHMAEGSLLQKRGVNSDLPSIDTEDTDNNK
ncbi:hypothetical protein TWF730_004496 [Orbilia blumenaviensis]|uniref:Uncharacterized protein n=1 Tax=Orbilia blumenaviensis TaxID=1796055 RepID=A0AAV9TYM2_9PEZI